MSSDEAAQHPIKQKLKSAVISVLAGDAGMPYAFTYFRNKL
jgi:hypothetical protein